MRSIVHLITTAACLFVLLSSTASAERSSSGDESHRWVPSIAITTGMLVDGARGEVESTLRPSDSASNDRLALWLGGSLEMMTPAWEPLGGRTRFFVHGGLEGNFGLERDVAKEGAPGPFIAPTTPRFGDDALVQGQGSAARVEPTGFQASAGVGFSITFDTAWRRIRVKPSFEYLYEELDISGVVHRAVSDDPAIPSFIFFVLSDSEEKAFHGIGPGLEVEADVGRAGPFEIALSVSGSAYKILGDRDVELTSMDPTATESATWRYRKNEWSYRSYVGLRFRWAPDGKRSR